MTNKGIALGELIKKRRTELGMTQDKLASLVLPDVYHSTAYQYISNCERGKASISPKYFFPLMIALQLDKKDLLEAYCLDYIDIILNEVVLSQIREKKRVDNFITKSLLTREKNKEGYRKIRIENAKKAWKMIGLENDK